MKKKDEEKSKKDPRVDCEMCAWMYSDEESSPKPILGSKRVLAFPGSMHGGRMESILLVPKKHFESAEKLSGSPEYVQEIHVLRLRLARLPGLQRKVRVAHLVWNNPCRYPRSAPMLKNHAHAELILERKSSYSSNRR
ncbi:MAG: hypothetical protein KGI60_00655 [Patescibacteria group bacterium]|nr:hypothetical protein [Patescibacteria group bacterium]